MATDHLSMQIQFDYIFTFSLSCINVLRNRVFRLLIKRATKLYKFSDLLQFDWIPI